MNPLIQGHSGTTSDLSRNAFSSNQGTNEDDSQSDPHPEAGIFGNQTMRNSGQEDRRDMVTGVQREREREREREKLCGHDMVTGVPIESLCQHDMTGIHKEFFYCSPSTSSGKQEKNRSTCQPQFRCETPLRQLRHTKFCWHFSSSQTTTTLQISKTFLTEFPNWQSHLRQRCPRATGNLRSLSYLKTFSKRASKFKFSRLKRKESITSILS